MDDDIEAEVIRQIRAANAKRRGYADFFGWRIDRDVEERTIAVTLCASLDAAGQPLATSVASRRRPNDPPDCEALDTDGHRIAIEVTELVDRDAIQAVRAGATYEWAAWDSDKLRGSLQDRLTAKDSITLKGGPYRSYVVVIHTDEPEMPIDRIRALIGDFKFPRPRTIDRAFLLLSYDPACEGYPFLEFEFEQADPSASQTNVP